MRHENFRCKGWFKAGVAAIAVLTLTVLPYGPAFAQSIKLK